MQKQQISFERQASKFKDSLCACVAVASKLEQGPFSIRDVMERATADTQFLNKQR